MAVRYPELRQQVYAAAMALFRDGLVRQSSGNVSVRGAEGVIGITPVSLSYEHLRPEAIVILDAQGRVLEGSLPPSSETPMHLAILEALPSIGGVVHTHSIFAMAVAATAQELPPVCLELVAIGAPVPVTDYVCPGTAKAGVVAAGALRSRPALRALLLRSHGGLAIGSTVEEACQNALALETGAQVYHRALETGMRPHVLTDEQVAEIREVYGKGHGAREHAGPRHA